jgi:E3 ubiquitin-protein ligase listerin
MAVSQRHFDWIYGLWTSIIFNVCAFSALCSFYFSPLTILVYEQGLPLSLQLLSAHLYHRALSTVPGVIRSWVNDCKDKQLLSTVTTYTSQHFSPVIIKSELARVKNPENIAGLQDENMSVKVSNSVNEVTATYLIDEQSLEITLKLPSDWPLHDIEIRDERVAVDESKWRAWIFKIQQIFWTQVSPVSVSFIESC